MPEIRPAAEADIETILTMQRQIHAEHLAWDAARWTTAMPLDDAYRNWLKHLVRQQSDGLALISEKDSRAVGYLIAEVEPESTKHWSPAAVYLHDIYVEPAFRRAGVARNLMDHALRWAANTHPTLQVRLITASPNESARAFFVRFGFRACVVEMVRDSAAR